MNDNLLLSPDWLIKLFGDTRLLIGEIPSLKEAWLNYYVMAVAVYQVTKWPRPHELGELEFDAFERELRAWERALIGQPEFNGFDVHVALSGARVEAITLPSWEADFVLYGIHTLAESIRAIK